MVNLDWKTTVKALVVLEFIASTTIWMYAHFVANNPYFAGVGIGLLIAWVTGALAYFYRSKK